MVDGEPQLHSHIAGVLPSHRRQRLGAAMKWHQRDWCLGRGIGTVTWTFDPLVRRNGSFNMQTLGAIGVAYADDLYGKLDDEINRGDPTDRLVVRWDLHDERVARAAAGGRIVVDAAEVGDDARTVPTPTDVERLRRLNHGQARQWRHDTREQFHKGFAEGHIVQGMTADGRYVFGPSQ